MRTFILLLVFFVPFIKSADADEIATLAGDQLTGKILEVNCSNIVFEYFGARLKFPLGQISRAASASLVPIRLQKGDRLTARVAITEGKVSIEQDRTMVTLATACSVPAERLAAVRGTGMKDEPSKQTKVDRPDALPAIAADNVPADKAAAEEAPSDAAKPETTEDQALSFLRNQAVLVPPRKIEMDLAFSYLRNEQSVINDKVLIFTPTFRVGIFRGMEGYLQLPYIWGQRQVVGGDTPISHEVSGIGDLRFGFRYNLVSETPAYPSIVAGLDVSAPTGQSPYIPPLRVAGAIDMRNPLNVTLGRGHWSLGGAVTAIRSYDPVIVFTTLSYTHFLPETYFGVEVAPGDVIELNGGLGFSINENSTVSGQIFADYVRQWSFGGRSISESASQPVSMRFAYTHILAAHDLIEPSIIFGLTRDANAAAITLAYSHQF